MEEKKKMGAPKIEINWEQFDKLCGIQCTLTEIADYFNCSEDTIERRCLEEKGKTFAEYFKARCSGGKRSLRRKQFETAMAGNVQMQIHLGKKYLGQGDKQEIEQNTKIELAYKLDD